MIIASLAIFPTSEGASVSRYVKEVIRIVEESGLKSATGGLLIHKGGDASTWKGRGE